MAMFADSAFYDLSTFYARQYGLSPLGTHKCDFTFQITKRANYLAMSHTSKSAGNAMCKPSGNFTPIGIINTRFKIKKKRATKTEKKMRKQNRPQLGLFIYDAAGWERHWRKVDLEGME